MLWELLQVVQEEHSQVNRVHKVIKVLLDLRVKRDQRVNKVILVWGLLV